MARASIGIKCLVLTAGLCAHAVAQEGNSDTSPARVISPTRGFQPAHSYALSDIESIDQASGALSLHIPLAQLPPGPAGFTAGVTLAYSSKYWETEPNVAEGVSPTYRLKRATAGGWRLALTTELEAEDVADRGLATDPCGPSTAPDLFHLRLIDPDGSRHQLFLSSPTVTMGSLCEPGTYKMTSLVGGGAQTWYTADGTYLRLVIGSSPESNSGVTSWVDNAEWTLFRPDGSKLHHLSSGHVELKDRNGNTITVSNSTSGATTTQTMADSFGHTLTATTEGNTTTVEMQVSYDESSQTPPQTTLRWIVQWTAVPTSGSFPQYQCIPPLHNQGAGYCPFTTTVPVVSQITLPNNLTYTFSYGGRFGEVSSVALPTGASVAYTWRLDPTGDGGTHCGGPCYYDVLANTINRKVLSHDGASDNWTYFYQIGGAGAILYSTIKAPDGAETRYDFDPIEFQFTSSYFAGAITRINHPDGSITQREWANNIPREYPQSGVPNQPTANKFMTRELTTTANSASPPSPVATSIRVFTADKNGNTTSREERGWVAYNASTTPASSSATLLRKTVTQYVNQSRDSQDAGVDPNAYSSALFTPGPVNLPEWIEVRSGAGTVVSRSAFEYQETAPSRMVGNLVRKWLWDSTKPNASTIAPGTSLNGSNAIAWNYVYSEHGNLLSETDPNSHATTYSYNSCGSDLYRSNKSAGAIPNHVLNWVYSHNCTNGQLLTQIDPTGLQTTITHDQYGRPTKFAEGVFRTTTRAYNDAARTIETHDDVDSSGDGKNVTILSYDQLGRISQQLQRATGLPDILTRTRYILGPGRNETWVSNPDSGEVAVQGWTVTRRDAMGRVCATEAFNGPADPAVASGCQTVSGGSTGSTLHTFDASLYWASETVTDAAGKVRRLYQDALGNLVAAVEDPAQLKYSTYYSYDTPGNLVGVRQVGTCAGDPVTGPCSGGQTRSFAYTSLQRLQTAANVESGQIQYSYDNAGNLTQRQQASLVRTTTYDDLNRPASQSYSDGTPTVTYAYYTAVSGQMPSGCGAPNGGMGRLASVGNSVSSSYYFYNQMGYAQCRRQATGTTNYDSRYTTTPQGVWKDVVYPSGRTVTTAFNGRGQTVAVGAYVNQATYWPHGGLNQVTLGNTTKQQSCYNERLQMTGMRVTVPGGSFNTKCTNVFGDLLTLGFGYGDTGNNGNLQSQAISVPYRDANTQWQTQTMTQQYGYDALNRVATTGEAVTWTSVPAGVGAANWSWTFTPDAYGNVSGTNTLGITALMPPDGSYINAATNQLLKYGAQPGTALPVDAYDGRGNLQHHPEVCPVGGNGCMQYDGEGRLKSVVNGGNTVQYEYDGEGHRVRKTEAGANAGTVVYVYDAGGNLMAEYGGAMTAGTRYLATDHLGSTRLVTDGAGNVVQRLDYFPFGWEIPSGESYGNRNGTRVSGYGSTDAALTVKFTGKERDAETGLDYFGARYYSGAQGRFTSPDQPLLDQDPADPQSWNLFSYVRNNPLRFLDPTGRECVTLDNGTQGDDGKGTVCKAVTEADKSKKPDVTISDFAPPSPMLLAVAQGAQQAGPVVNAAGYATGGVMAGAFAGMAYGAFAGGQAIGALGLTLLPSQARNIEAIENAIANHVTLMDLSGAAKETAGFTIRTGSKVWNHRQELIETARNLRGAVRALQGSLNDPRHGTVAREAVQQAIQKAETALRQIDAALRR